jgi:pimeloyl-ACP methyl ester carboxylesterase
VRRLDVDEVDVDAVDLGDELRQRVQPRVDAPEVVIRRPVARKLLNRSSPLVRRGLLACHPRRFRRGRLHSTVFSTSRESRAKSVEFLGRISGRSVDRDEPADLVARDAQLEAIPRWGIPDPSKLDRLGAFSQPTLVANGDDDPMMITDNSRLLARHLPNADLRIYPDAGHGSLDQYPEDFANDVNEFLKT